MTAPHITLSDSDKRYWHPIPDVLEWLSAEIPPDASVLEIGPGHIPFPRATHFVDFAPVKEITDPSALTICDMCAEPLPFPDKSFDFVYARHVIEDSWNPMRLCAEMERVGRRGYIETPSPLAELCRGVDGPVLPYRGYHHHRYIVWAFDGRLNVTSKYPMVEYFTANDDMLIAALRSGARYWNTYFLWEDRISVKHWQNPLDFDLGAGYPKLLGESVGQSMASTNEFCDRLILDRKAA